MIHANAEERCRAIYKAVKALEELEILRQQNAELEQKYQNATTYCEEHANFEGYCCVVCLMNERDKLKEQNAELIENSERLAKELEHAKQWLDVDNLTTQSYEFGYLEALNNNTALMSRIKGE